MSFRAFDVVITVFTDDPETAALSPRCSFGVDPDVRPYEDTLSSAAPFLVMVKDMNRAAACMEELPGAERLRVGVGAPAMAWDAARGAAVAALHGGAQQRAAIAFTATALFVRLLLKARGLFFIHAACAARDNAAVLIVGENEAGKSSLAHALTLSGMSLVADDNLPLFVEHSTVRAVFVREVFNAGNLDAARVDALLARGFERAHIPGFLLPPPAVESVPARVVIFPFWAEKDAAPVPVSGAFALKALYAACKTPLAGDDIKVYDALVARLAGQAVCRRVGLERRPGRGASAETVARILKLAAAVSHDFDV